MSEIALYDVLTKLGAKPEEAKEAVTNVAGAKDLATKADLIEEIEKLKGFTKERLAKIETELKYLRWVLLPLNVAILIKLFL